MKKIVITSKNPAKIEAVLDGFGRMFPGQEFETISVSVSSGVREQPMSDSESLLGAVTRVENAFTQYLDADFYIGIEGGIDSSDNEMAVFSWVVIKSKAGHMSKAKTGTFQLPSQIVGLINQGKTLGEADDIVFSRIGANKKNGSVGLLTDNVIDRASYSSSAVILALIPFKNEKIYFNTTREE